MNKKLFKRNFPCPICKGYSEQERGIGKRCYGYLSGENWAHCTRKEWSGGLPVYRGDTYAHMVYGDCKCGVTHNPAVNKGTMENIIKYDYADEQGEVLYQVCRTNSKGFFQRRPDGKGGWINKLDDVRRVLYHLPELLEADESATVFICEGEKDADALIERGLVATTNAGGAGKWRYLDYNEMLKGRCVVVLPDNDEPGRKHAAQVAKSLNGFAAKVRVVELPNLPEKGDVSDWFAAGGTVEQLQEIVSNHNEDEVIAAPTSNMVIQSAAELLARELPEPKFAVNGVLSEGVTIFAGKPKLGKSWLGLGMAIAVASGGYVLGAIPVKQGDVLYLALEDGERRLQDRLQKILGNDSAPKHLSYALTWKRLNEGGIEDLEDWLNGKPDARLIVIDTLKRVRPRGRSNAQLYDLDYEALEPLAGLALKHGVSIVVIHHTRKAESEDPLDLISGSFGLSGSADGALILKRARGQAGAELHITGRDFEEQALALQWDNMIYGWKLVGDAEELCLGRERKEIIDLIRLEGAKRPKEVATDLKRNDVATRKLMASMFKDGQLDNDGTGLYSIPDKKSNGNSSNYSHSSNSGNSGNSELETANSKQSYSESGAGNSVNLIPNNSLEGIVTRVTGVSMDAALEEEIAERAAIYEFEGGHTREQAEVMARAEILANLAAANNESGGRKSTAELFAADSASIAA